jgi:subtilisin-like proprotein convertase family protein
MRFGNITRSRFTRPARILRATKKKGSALRRPQIEALEPRQVMSADVPMGPYGPIGSQLAAAGFNPYSRAYIPSDPYYEGFQWNLKDYDLTAQGANIDAAWEQMIIHDGGRIQDRNSFAFGDQVVIAIVDDGVQPDHPELLGGPANQRPFRFRGSPALPTSHHESCDLASAPGNCAFQGHARQDSPGGFFVDIHGTAVAGIALAERDNGIGISGVAPDAHWISNKVLPTFPIGAAPQELTEYLALAPRHPFCLNTNEFWPIGSSNPPMRTRLGVQFVSTIDVFVNAWGPLDGFDWRGPDSVSQGVDAAINCGHAFGRGGLGSNYIWAAGNGQQFGDNVNYDGYANNRQVIAVAAIDDLGRQAAYSEPGASLLVSAPSSARFELPGGGIPSEVLTTDIVDTTVDRNVIQEGDVGGYNYHTGPNDPRGNPPFPPDLDPFEDTRDLKAGLGYTSYGHYSATDAQGAFGGTSAAAPLVGGVVALMLDANPNLSWRDVQHILVRTARKNDGADSDWADNRADPPLHVNHKYGFGAVDALAAVTTARNWPGVAPQTVFSTGRIPVERGESDPPGTAGRLIPDDGRTVISQLFNFSEDQETANACLDIERPLQCTLDGVPIPDDYDGSTFPNIDWIEVVLETDHEFAGDLEVTLYAPDGAGGGPGQFKSILAQRHNSAFDYDNWVFSTARHWGEIAHGNWRLEIKDTKVGDVGSWVSWEIRFYGGSVPPVAIDDFVRASSGIPKTINVLNNDTGPFISSTVSIQTQPANGIALVQPNGSIRYTSNAGFLGTDSFTYVVRDRFGQPSNVATVFITVVPFNPAPVANADQLTIAAGTAVTIDVGDDPGRACVQDTDGDANLSILFNDCDAAGEALDERSVQFIVLPPSSKGTLTGPNATTGDYTFTPAPGWPAFGSTDRSVTFTYRLKDASGLQSNNTTVTITYGEPPPPPPIARNDLVFAIADQPVDINVLANDSPGAGAPPLDPSTVTVTSPPVNGDLSHPDAAGMMVYTPYPNFTGVDTFNYSVADGLGRIVAATVTIVVNGPPFAITDVAVTDEETPIVIDVLDNDSDPDVDGFVDPNSIQFIERPQYGSVAVVTVDPAVYGVPKAVRYTPDCNFAGDDVFSYTIRDNEGVSATMPAPVFVSVLPTNDPPTAVDDAVRTNMNTPVAIQPAANDRDLDPADGAVPSTMVVPFGGGPAHGTLVFDGVSTFTYTPTAGYVGGDSFRYYIRDTLGAVSNEGIVRIRVGMPVSLTGLVYADLNNDGDQDSGELGIANVEVQTTVVDGGYTHTQSVRTDATGAFAFVETPGNSLILPRGTYTLREVHPALWQDGIEAPGTPAPASTTNDTFSGITLGPGATATNYRFGERNLRSDFTILHFPQARYYTSASLEDSFDDDDPFVFPRPSGINLSQGNVWFSFDEGLTGARYIEAIANSGGSVRLDVFANGNLNTPIASSGAPSGFARVEFTGTAAPQFVRISGAGANFDVEVGSLEPCVSTVGTGAEVLVRSSSWSPAFLDYLRTSGLGDGGYRVPSGSLNQLMPLPWSNIDQIIVHFDNFVSTGPSTMTVNGVQTANYGTSSYSFDPATNTATWTLTTPVRSDRIRLDLSAAPTPVNLNSVTGGPEEFFLNLLTNDVNGNGVGNIADVVEVRNRQGQSTGGGSYSIFHDLNGSGAIDATDLFISQQNAFNRLPAGTFPSPSPAAAAPASTTEEGGTVNVVAEPLRLRRVTRGPRDTAVDAIISGSTGGSNNESPTLRARRIRRDRADATLARDDALAGGID